jgi:hypothetical protein
MVRRIGSALQILLGLAVVIALTGGVGWIIYQSVTQAPAVIAAIVTGFAALFGLFFQRYLEQQREDERLRRERMTPIYEELVTTFYRGAGGGELAETELTAFFNKLAQRLLLWGGPSIIEAFNAWRHAIKVLPEGSPESLFSFEQLMYAMRADLGQSNENLGKGDLLRVFINDIDDYLDELQSEGT